MMEPPAGTAEDDVKAADVKTKVLKFVSDINGVQFARSRAFADAVKGGVGWLDDGVRDDPTQDILYSRYEDWRCVLWDSSAMELDLSDARYIFRWRWVDEDVATLMFPGRADRVRSAVEDWSQHANPLADEDTWTTPHDPSGQERRGGTLHGLASGFADGSQRRRIKLIECQYKAPVATKVVMAGPFKGAIFNPRDHVMAQALGQHGGSIIDKIMMRVHMAVFTESDMLAMGPSLIHH